MSSQKREVEGSYVRKRTNKDLSQYSFSSVLLFGHPGCRIGYTNSTLTSFEMVPDSGPESLTSSFFDSRLYKCPIIFSTVYRSGTVGRRFPGVVDEVRCVIKGFVPIKNEGTKRKVISTIKIRGSKHELQGHR